MTDYKPQFGHWSLFRKAKHQLCRVCGLIRWGVFQRGECSARRFDQWHKIIHINTYFRRGWRLYGSGDFPWLNKQFSIAWVNTLFMFVDREDTARTGYCYRISNDEVEGQLGIYCISTNEEFKLNVSDKDDLEIYLMIASASVALLVDGDNWTPKRCQDIYDGIAVSMGLVKEEEAE